MTFSSQTANHARRPTLMGLGVLGAAFAIATTTPALAVAPVGQEFEGVDVKNKLGEQVDLQIPLIAPERLANSLEAFWRSLETGGAL